MQFAYLRYEVETSPGRRGSTVNLNCDTIQGIGDLLIDLAGLHRLHRERQSAAAQQVQLHEFIVLGKFILTSGGAVCRCEFLQANTAPPKDWTFPEDLLPVVTLDRLKSELGRYWSVQYRSHFSLPPVHAVCKGCGKGWSINTAHDAVQAGTPHPRQDHPRTGEGLPEST